MPWAIVAIATVCWVRLIDRGCEYFPLISVLLYRAIDPASTTRLRRCQGDGQEGRQVALQDVLRCQRAKPISPPRFDRRIAHFICSWHLGKRGECLCSETKRKNEEASMTNHQRPMWTREIKTGVCVRRTVRDGSQVQTAGTDVFTRNIPSAHYPWAKHPSVHFIWNLRF